MLVRTDGFVFRPNGESIGSPGVELDGSPPPLTVPPGVVGVPSVAFARNDARSFRWLSTLNAARCIGVNPALLGSKVKSPARGGFGSAICGELEASRCCCSSQVDFGRPNTNGVVGVGMPNGNCAPVPTFGFMNTVDAVCAFANALACGAEGAAGAGGFGGAPNTNVVCVAFAGNDALGRPNGDSAADGFALSVEAPG